MTEINETRNSKDKVKTCLKCGGKMITQHDHRRQFMGWYCISCGRHLDPITRIVTPGTLRPKGHGARR